MREENKRNKTHREKEELVKRSKKRQKIRK